LHAIGVAPLRMHAERHYKMGVVAAVLLARTEVMSNLVQTSIFVADRR